MIRCDPWRSIRVAIPRAPRTFIEPKYYIHDELANLRTPTLFIWGDKDAAASVEAGKEACKIMPNASIEVLKDAGHLPWLDEPGISGELIVDFLK